MTQETKIRVYTDGVYDLLHYGHMEQMRQAKEKFPNVHLIVGVAGDEDINKLKGPHVLNLDERVAAIQHVKYVDEIIAPCPWIITPEFMEKHRIDYVAQDPTPYPCGDNPDIYSWLKTSRRFLNIQRTTSISTSRIIQYVLDNADQLKKNICN